MVLTAEAFALAGQPASSEILVDVALPAGSARDRSIATIRRLSTTIYARSAEMAKADAYYRGEQGLRFTSSKQRADFGKAFGKYAENLCGLVVDAVEERLDIEGFRYPHTDEPGSDPDETSTDADADAWRIWQDNQLDAKSQIAHQEALIKGFAYVLVSPMADDMIAGRSPRITIEDALATIVEFQPGTTLRTVGMKRWDDPVAKRTYANLYYPDRIEKWQSSTWRDLAGRLRSAGGQFAASSEESWEPRVVPGEPWPLYHELGVVPLIPLVNRPRLDGSGRSEIADVIPIQDALNKIAIDMIVASDAGAFRQKWATGVEIPIDPETEKPVGPWKPDEERILSVAVADAKFGTFEATQLDNYTSALDQKVQAVASISRTPYHYFLRQGGQPPSGESLKSSETGLVRKAKRRQRQYGEGWEEAIRIAFLVLKDARGEVLDNETIWSSPETMTEAEHIDALVKRRQGLKVPLRQLWEDAGYTPGQISRFQALLKAEAELLAGTLVEPIGANAEPGKTPFQVQERTEP